MPAVLNWDVSRSHIILIRPTDTAISILATLEITLAKYSKTTRPEAVIEETA